MLHRLTFTPYLIVLTSFLVSVQAQSTKTCADYLHLLLENKSPQERILSLIEARKKKNLPIHLDIGGEGRYSDAINLNPYQYTSTTGEPGQLIPRWLPGRGEAIPLSNQSVHRITVESAPISQDTIFEMLRVLRPRGTIHLYHPFEYAEVIRKKIVQSMKIIKYEFSSDEIGMMTIIYSQ